MHEEMVVCSDCARMAVNGSKFKHYTRKQMLKLLFRDGLAVGHMRCQQCKDADLRAWRKHAK